MAVVFQILGRTFAIPQVSQYITGPAVNAILLITTYVCGTWWGIAVGIMTPLTAWIIGQLPQPLGPFIPFIMIGNMIFVLFFGLLMEKKKWGKPLGVFVGSLFKFLFLYIAALKLVKLFKISLPKKLASSLVVMMGVPQFVTAIIGGALALIIIKIINKKIKLEDYNGEY